MEASRELPKVPRSLPCSASIQRVSVASDAPCGSGGLKSTITGPVPSDASAARLRSRSSTASVLLCPNPNSESLQRSFSSRHCTREASSVASHAHVSKTDVNSGADSSERQRPAQDRSARGRSSGVSKLPAILLLWGDLSRETPPTPAFCKFWMSTYRHKAPSKSELLARREFVIVHPMPEAWLDDRRTLCRAPTCLTRQGSWIGPPSLAT